MDKLNQLVAIDLDHIKSLNELKAKLKQVDTAVLIVNGQSTSVVMSLRAYRHQLLDKF